jgi:class 3 adenylate cyclase
MSNDAQRREPAIMAADVAGFSATMEHNGVESQAAAVSDRKTKMHSIG